MKFFRFLVAGTIFHYLSRHNDTRVCVHFMYSRSRMVIHGLSHPYNAGPTHVGFSSKGGGYSEANYNGDVMTLR